MSITLETPPAPPKNEQRGKHFDRAISKAKGGPTGDRSPAALASLATSHRRLVFTLANRFRCLRREDYEDLEAVGMLALLQAAATWDRNRGAFSTHAYRAIYHAMINARRLDRWFNARFEGPRDALDSGPPSVFSLVWLSDPAGDVGEGREVATIGELLPAEAPDPADVIADRAEVVGLWATVASTLPEKHARIIWRHYAEDATFGQIGEELGMTRQAVHQLHGTALRLLAARHKRGNLRPGPDGT